MSQKKIMDLTEVQSVDENTCYVPVDNGSATVRIKLHNLEASATESAESYAQAAAASATSASGYADAAALSSASASTYATNASESAQDAALSAGSASNSADAAAASASNAASSAANVTAIVIDVSQQAAVALASAKEAKSFAVGGTDTRAGEDTDNAKYYSTQAGTSATNAAASESNAATSEANAAASETNAAASETNAASSETNAASSETNAAASETNAGASATAAALSEAAAALSRAAAATSSEDAEAWAVGTKNNVPVSNTDPAYNNNAKYWAEAAAGAAGGGVTSFNGRSGAVSSQAHDYSANQVDFNNADNGFTATNTQAAIEEVAGNLSGLDRSLASVAKSGSYNDLSNTPNLATVATSGSYADLSNTPTLGTAAAKNSTNTISSGSTALIESGSVYSLKQTLETGLGNKVNTSDVANNLTTTAAGKVLDARQGKTLNDSKANTNLLGQKWSSSTSYLVRQYCISGNVLYKCILANTNHQPPNSTYWKATDVNSELAEIASSSTAQTATVIDDFTNNNTEHSVTVDLTQYHHIGCAVKGASSNALTGVIDVPISVFKQFGVIISIGPTSNSQSLQLKVTYVSDTQIKVKGSNLDSYWGGKVFVY